jgi:hypothetical protein
MKQRRDYEIDGGASWGVVSECYCHLGGGIDGLEARVDGSVVVAFEINRARETFLFARRDATSVWVEGLVSSTRCTVSWTAMSVWMKSVSYTHATPWQASAGRQETFSSLMLSVAVIAPTVSITARSLPHTL